MRILDERREALVDQERALLERFIGFLKGFGAPSEDVELVRRALSDLEELFLLVIVGEFNSGKSAFINALLGAEISEEGVTPTTNRITVLRHSPEARPARAARRGPREGVPQRLPARDRHRGYAGDERDHPPPRGAQPRVRPQKRPGPVRHLR
jgi:Dynamin family